MHFSVICTFRRTIGPTRSELLDVKSSWDSHIGWFASSLKLRRHPFSQPWTWRFSELLGSRACLTQQAGFVSKEPRVWSRGQFFWLTTTLPESSPRSSWSRSGLYARFGRTRIFCLSCKKSPSPHQRCWKSAVCRDHCRTRPHIQVEIEQTVFCTHFSGSPRVGCPWWELEVHSQLAAIVGKFSAWSVWAWYCFRKQEFLTKQWSRFDWRIRNSATFEKSEFQRKLLTLKEPSVVLKQLK